MKQSLTNDSPGGPRKMDYLAHIKTLIPRVGASGLEDAAIAQDICNFLKVNTIA